MPSLKLDIPKSETLKPKIIIFGVGGAGGNAINNMIRSDLEGVEFVAANTDAQSLESSLAKNKIQLGLKITKGLGAGSFPDRGKMAAEENLEEIEELLKDSNMIFIAAGMGGGTGTGAAPVIAKLARENDILTVGVVTKPFHFEGKYRMETAEAGIEELKKYVDTLIIIPNQNLFRIANENTTFESAFKMADDVLHAGVRGVTDLITMPGLVNLDFADIRTIMTKMGKAMMGTGEAEGDNRAILACEAAISNPLLDDISISGAKGVLVNMTGGPDMTLFEADMAVNAIKKEVDPNANIIFGSAFNENMKGKIRISVVATGIDPEDFKNYHSDNSKVYEPTRFRVEKEGSNNEIESFFNPGVSIKIDEDFPEEEIVTSPKKPVKKAKDEEEDLFIEEDLEQEVQKVEKKSSVKKVEQKQEKESKPEKEQASGFSLFSFMNINKDKSDSSIEDDLDFYDNISLENSNKLSTSEIEKPAKKDVKKSKISHEEETIFDDDKDENIAEEEDDILNIPAFFRRKKK